uniref:Putative histone h4 n=1 Tax=Ixodes ricinus TaxID=34613 RepID=A0A0K8RBI3_IXORI
MVLNQTPFTKVELLFLETLEDRADKIIATNNANLYDKIGSNAYKTSDDALDTTITYILDDTAILDLLQKKTYALDFLPQLTEVLSYDVDWSVPIIFQTFSKDEKRARVIPALKSLLYRFYNDPQCNVLSTIFSNIRIRDLAQNDKALEVRIIEHPNPIISELLESWLILNVYDLDEVEQNIFNLHEKYSVPFVNSVQSIYTLRLNELEDVLFGPKTRGKRAEGSEYSIENHITEFRVWCGKTSRHQSWSTNHPLFSRALKEVFRSQLGSKKWESDVLYWMNENPGKTYFTFKSLESKVLKVQNFIDAIPDDSLTHVMNALATTKEMAKQYIFLATNKIEEDEFKAIQSFIDVVVEHYRRFSTFDKPKQILWAAFHPAASRLREILNYKILDESNNNVIYKEYDDYSKLINLLNSKSKFIPYVKYDWRIRQYWYNDISSSAIKAAIVYTDWNVLMRNTRMVEDALSTLESLVDRLRGTPYML